MKGKIYKITNKINNKVYIGKTYRSIKQRFTRHIRNSKKEEYKHYPVYKAFNKHGIENFTVEEIGEYEQGLLEEMEIKFIQEYDSFYNGYNATKGGNGMRTFKYSDEEVIKKYKELKYINKTSEYFNCANETIRGVLKSNNIRINCGFKYSDEEVIGKYKELGYIHKTAEYFDCNSKTISKILNFNSIEIKNHKKERIKQAKKVAKLNKDTLEVLKIYESLAEAGIDLGDINKRYSISNACNGKTKTAYGYKWEFI